jgi:predicted MFS family arabinose efflux permease
MLSLAMAFWLGLCITNSLDVFLALTYFSAVFTGITQIMLPLVAELSTDANRASNISIVATGPTLGILLARILSGIVANYTQWRNVYWLALVLQSIVVILLYLFMPAYPVTNQVSLPVLLKSYPSILFSILTLYVSHPVLVQACLLSFCTFFTVSSYWTTLTFLLSAPPYTYSTFVIGLFGIIGASTLILGPLYGRYIVTPLSAPLLSASVGKAVSLTGIIIGTFVGVHSVAGPIIEAFLLDAGLMILQISNRVAIHNIEPKRHNKVNTAFVAMLYLGSLIGTKAGNQVYERFTPHGWLASGCLSIGVIGLGILVVLARGPHEEQWVGWTGGWGRAASRTRNDEEGGQASSETKNRGKPIQSRKVEEKKAEAGT